MNKDAMWLFRSLVYLWLLVYALHTIPLLDMFYGEDSVMMPRRPRQAGVIQNVLYMLNYSKDRAVWVLGVHVVICLMSLTGVLGWVPRILAWFTGWMLYYGCIPSYNGCNLLMLMCSFYCIPFSLLSRTSLGSLLANFGYLASRWQVIMVYAVAGFYKLMGQDWIDGSAIGRTLYLDAFVSDFSREVFLQFPGLLSVLTWIGLFYQVTFPFVIWFKKIKTPFLLIGIGFHLGISIILGLWDFGTAMIIGYVLFWNPSLEFFKKKWPWFRKALE
ncbi:MAG: HTTM domain-containing protein [Flavobacteriales bacterium]|nr:HTTM domain-containing protein [Flavobacteriales bacterium]